MDAIIRMFRPAPVAAFVTRRHSAPDFNGLVALHPDAAWGRVCITPGVEFIAQPHTQTGETWLFYPDSADAPERGVLLEIHFGSPSAPERPAKLAHSLLRTLQHPMPVSPVHPNELPLRIAGTATDVEYLEWEDQPLEQLRFTRAGRRITIAGWRSTKPLPALAEEDLQLLDPALLEALKESA